MKSSASNPHAHVDARSLAMHQAIAVRLRESPDLLNDARARIERWQRQRGLDAPGSRWWNEWLCLLDQGLETVVMEVTADTERGRQLRQNSPFPGVLSKHEVWEFKRAYSPCNETISSI